MITVMENILQSLNGRITGLSGSDDLVKDKIACAIGTGVLWSSVENNDYNAWTVRFSDSYVGYWGKEAAYAVRAVAAF